MTNIEKQGPFIYCANIKEVKEVLEYLYNDQYDIPNYGSRNIDFNFTSNLDKTHHYYPTIAFINPATGKLIYAEDYKHKNPEHHQCTQLRVLIYIQVPANILMFNVELFQKRFKTNSPKASKFNTIVIQCDAEGQFDD